MKVKSENEVAQSYPTLHDPMDYSLSGSSIHGILLARVLEWVAIASSSNTLADLKAAEQNFSQINQETLVMEVEDLHNHCSLLGMMD